MRYLRQPSSDLLVAAGGGVLVDQRRGHGGVAEAVHEFGQGGAGLGGERRAGVAEVVPAQVLSSGGAGASVHLVEGAVLHVPAGFHRREQQSVRAGCGPVVEVGEEGGRMWGGIATSRSRPLTWVP